MASPMDASNELLRAYRTLDVPLSATTHLIRQRHRQLLKRWHPDLYRQDTPQHSEATHMAKLINEAYSRIKYAPLRYCSPFRKPSPKSGDPVASAPPWPDLDRDEDYPRLDRIEFWVRFVCGALLGVFVSLWIALYTYAYARRFPWGMTLLCASTVVGFAFASARLGDRFWGAILGLRRG